MATISYYARGDASSGASSTLQVQNTNQVPTTLLTFEDYGGTGDLDFDLFASGAEDPDTRVYLNGDLDSEPLTFTVISRGTLPTKNNLNGLGPNNLDLRSKEVTVLELSNGDRFFIVTDPTTLSTFSFDASDPVASDLAFQTMNDFPNGNFTLSNLEICYAEGTLLATPEGPKPVEELAPGDLLTTVDGRQARVGLIIARQVLARDMRIFETLRPVILPAGHFGPGRPTRDLIVTPLHRILLDDPELGRLFGEERMYVLARDIPGAVPATIEDRTFYHVVCDHHAALVAEGLGSESLYPGDVALLRLSPRERARVEAVFGDAPKQTAFPCLTHREATVWRNSVQSREKRAACTGVQ